MAGKTRTVVMGFDGIDARLTGVLMRAGLLASLREMAEVGGFRRVISTTPAESAVAWTSFAMGANPGRTGVFDFIERAEGSYGPRLAGSEVVVEAAGPGMGMRWGVSAGAGMVSGAAGYAVARRMSRRRWMKACAGMAAAGLGLAGAGMPLVRWLPRRVERVRSTVAGRPWWDRLSERGWRCTVLRMPMAYPAEGEAGVELVAGLGVPDMRGTNGTYCVVTDESAETCGKGEVLRVAWKGDQSTVHLAGPEDPVGWGGVLHARMELKRLGEEAVRVTCGGASQIVKRGEWSGWLPLRFAASPIVKRHGMVRVFCCAEASGMRLYVTPVEFDPAMAVEKPISWPIDFAREMCRGVGRYHTMGWETQTWGLVDGVLDERAYLEDVRSALEMNEAQLQWQLERKGWDAFMLVVQATDQAQHMFFDDRVAAMRDGGAVDMGHPLVEVYRRMDAMVGRALGIARQEGWRVVVMSDHGFARYRRAVNLNTWLARRGWLALKDRDRWDEEDAQRVLSRGAWENVDWFNTRAYALGLGGIYLNVAGREPGGIVKRHGEYAYLQEKLAAMLLGWRDPETGEAVCGRVYRSQDVYDGPHRDRGPDLIVGLNEGWRVSSASAVGGIPRREVAENASHWKGDHCGIDASLIPGICLTNFPIDWPDPLSIETLAGQIWPQLGDGS